MKRKLLILTFLVFLMSIVFTVSVSAGKVYIADWLTGECQTIVLDDNATSFRIQCQNTSEGLKVFIDGKQIALEVGDFPGDMVKAVGLNDDFAGTGASLEVNSSFYATQEMKCSGWRFFSIAYEFQGEYADKYRFRQLQPGDALKVGDMVFASMMPHFGPSTASGTVFATDYMTITMVDGMAITGDDSFAESCRSHLTADGKRIEGHIYMVDHEFAITQRDQYKNCSFMWIAEEIPNMYDFGISSYDYTTGKWTYSRFADASVVSAASSYQIVNREGVGSLKLVNGSGTSFTDLGQIEGTNLVFTFDKSKVLDGGYICNGFGPEALPIDLHGRETECVDGVLTIYVGELAPTYLFLEQTPEVNASLTDIVKRTADMITAVPLMMLFVVLLPLISFGVGLLVRTKSRT